MKGTIIRFISAGAALLMILAPSITRVYAGRAAGDPYKLESGLDPENSKIKPILSLSQIELPLNKAKEEPEQSIELTVTGAEGKYASTGLHVKFDDRLEILKDDGDYATSGPALKRIGMIDSSPDWLDENNVPHGVFVMTGASSNKGRDGVMWTFLLRLPDDIQVGDVYPIEIYYQKGKSSGDLFTDLLQDKEGRLMDAWVFTHGIEQGYIKITEEEPTTVPEPVIKVKKGDPNGDGIIDAVDASYMMANYAKISTGVYEPDIEDIMTCDVNDDGMMDAVDASIVLAYYAYVSSGGTDEFEVFLETQMFLRQAIDR
ncbi:MAG: hypothetical protein J6U00_07110 [Ruminococcus sp.]|uniref:dockerin type I domain-containing protein n=1 Tax=Ruminococcus sp. TaxID=41978 RepID=UPI001B23B7F8|nr:dockerin type I domain-containing protein [Ruminococcus sp.]MBO7473758.1 hypothetical protein [Ruminococcus sp.]